MMFARRLSIALAIALLSVSTLCAEPFTASLASGEVEVSLRADEEIVSFERDFHLTISTTYPADQKVMLPELVELRGRFQGFSLAEGFRREAEKLPDGRLCVEDRWRLVPEPSATCRLAPFAVEAYPVTGSAEDARSFATAPVVFPVAELEAVAGDVELETEPYWIAPTFKMVFGWIIVALLVVALLALVVYLLRRVHHAAKLRRMSPSERAYAELEALLNLRLTEKGLFKDFYIELTQVVRRYIERSHGIHAPEQTTEEFLAAAKEHPHFSTEVVRSLSDFLHFADLVKFARRNASTTMTDDAVRTARDYIKTDSEAVRRLEAETSSTTSGEEVRS